MTATARIATKPRKSPLQRRSVLTVEAILEAAIQVLLSHGLERLTTTRVAERAGVSVGTLYQYYPNKQSLLFALLEQKLATVCTAVEAACEESSGLALGDMMRRVVERFVDAKMERTDISTALYRIAADIGGPELVKRAERRTLTALLAMFETAADRKTKLDSFAVQMMWAAMGGATRSVLEDGATPEKARKLRAHLVHLCDGYLHALNET